MVKQRVGKQEREKDSTNNFNLKKKCKRCNKICYPIAKHCDVCYHEEMGKLGSKNLGDKNSPPKVALKK